MKIKISDNDIKYAEEILLPESAEFDNQRKVFIKSLENIDLQAVPGSGKTTALLAKLLLLEKHLPFRDGSGILVISHTNAAVDEIKKRIEIYCPQLFTYPNFVGTIQGFVDKFLAIPFYANLYKKKPYRIDDEVYKEKVFIPGKAYGWLVNNPNMKEKVLYESRLNENDELVFGFNTLGKFPLKTKTSATYKAILEMKLELRNRGILSFDDAYFLAIKAVGKYPFLKRLLQRRFCYVFVDEMQDMDKYQYDLLENLFYDGGNSKSVYQRIGDKSQAIFSGIVKLEDFWSSDGREVLNIDGSCRFSSEIADVVQCFALTGQKIKGRSLHTSIKPHLLVYTSDTITKVLSKFVDIIKEKEVGGMFPVNIDKTIKAIGWRKSADDKNKVTIKDYFPNFNENTQRSKIDFLVLKDYLFTNKNDGLKKGDLAEIRKNILNSFLKALRYEKINNFDGQYYTKKRLLDFLKEQHEDLYQEFEFNLFLWCRDIYKGSVDIVYKKISQYLPKFLKEIFGKTKMSSKTRNFINNDLMNSSRKTEPIIDNKIDNIYRCNEVEIEVGTIHSIKGETHSATLYMETYYQGSYESQRLKEFFKGNIINGSEKTRVRESLKMAFVGMSRPSYLLCVAVHKDHVKDYLSEIPDSKWDKVEV